MLSQGDAASKQPFVSAVNNGSSAKRSTRAPLASASLAFPAEDPDEDRDVLANDGKTLRKKRSALFYPSAGLAAKSNQQPFSRSAAKRDSIMALGSIGYLQHLYTKQGIANRNRPLTKGAMTLAIGPAGEAMLSSSADHSSESPLDSAATGSPTSSQIGGEGEELEQLALPPSPKAGSYARPKYLDVARPLEADTQALRAQLITDLDRLSSAWDLSEWIEHNTAVQTIQQLLSTASKAPGQTSTSSSADPLVLINVTTKAIRSVRSYVLALPRRSKVPTTFEPSRRDRFKRQSSFSGVPRSGEVGTPVATRTSEIFHRDSALADGSRREASLSTPMAAPLLGRRLSSTQDQEDEDHLGVLRKAALEMLSALKEMEEKSRLAPLGGNGCEADQSIPTTPKVEKADDTVPGATIPDPDESSIIAFADPASGAGYLYRSDLVLSDFDAERKILQGWLQTVDKIIASTSAPSIHIELVDSSSSSGARQKWLTPDLTTAERVSSFMIDHCESGVGAESSSRLNRLLDARDDMEALLPLLSDGYLLCRAFNEAVRRSDKPWGYISPHEMHDLEAEEAALLQKEMLRAKQAQEDEAIKFQTRAHRKSISEDASSVNDNGTAIKGFESETLTNRPGWTFRKSENLRTWAAALKLRHHIQTTATRAVPAKPSTTGPTYGSLGMGKLALHAPRAASESHATSLSSRRGSLSGSSSKIDFDPAKVARKEAGWQEMLTTLLVAWIEAMASEQTQAR